MSDEMTPTEAIVANVEYHSRLLTSISNLDYIASALEHQAAYVADLENQKVQSAERVLALNKRTKKERKDHETLRDSTTRRLAHKLTGRKELYEAKESKEERHVSCHLASRIFLLTMF
jgi:ABC-type Zn uptake system ZnuABC Zn-binding protein ZnuA